MIHIYSFCPHLDMVMRESLPSIYREYLLVLTPRLIFSTISSSKLNSRKPFHNLPTKHTLPNQSPGVNSHIKLN